MDTSEDTVVTLKSKSLIVRFEPSLFKAAESRAKKDGVSVAAIIRMAVRALLEPKKTRR